jgi:serine/threonine protein kinase
MRANNYIDLNNKNVMWGMIPLENLDRTAKYKVLGSPLKLAVPDKPWRQGEVVKPIEIPDHLRTERFYLGDFGLAMKPETSVTQPGRPPIHYCSPERLHNHNPSFVCDIWSYMCLFTELYVGFTPFHTWANGGIVTTIVNLIGPLPAEWKGHYCTPSKTLDSWYAQDSTPKPESKLEALILRGRPDTSPTERKHALSIMSRGFSISPEKRPTATQLLRDPSFKAIIDIHCG